MLPLEQISRWREPRPPLLEPLRGAVAPRYQQYRRLVVLQVLRVLRHELSLISVVVNECKDHKRVPLVVGCGAGATSSRGMTGGLGPSTPHIMLASMRSTLSRSHVSGEEPEALPYLASESARARAMLCRSRACHLSVHNVVHERVESSHRYVSGDDHDGVRQALSHMCTA